MTPLPAAHAGHLATNVVHFGRVLRAAGLPVGTDRVIAAQQALQVAGFERREDFHAVLRACLLDRIEHAELFDQAFALFWKDPDLLGRMRALLLPKVQLQRGAQPEERQNRRLADAMYRPRPAEATPPATDEAVELDAALSVSDRELLRQADFDSMSSDEWRTARRLLALLRPQLERLRSRRMQPATRAGRPDWRATLRTSARQGGDAPAPRWRVQRREPAPLLVLADISGSMSRYSRTLLHFAHTLGQGGPGAAPLESFVFGTRLTRTTRLLARRDPDLAVAAVVRAVQDWSGGTRISQSLHDFNRQWARRVLDGRATVLLITDGLEHGDTAALHQLDTEMALLARSCRRLIWLNPLLRFARFEPRAGGVRTMLPHVERMLPVHNLQSLQSLLHALASLRTAGPQRPALGKNSCSPPIL